MKVKYEEVGTVNVSGRAIAGSVLAVALVAGIGYGGYELLWATRANSTDRAAQINRQSLGFQQARVDEINRKMADLASLRSLTKDATLNEDQVNADKAQEQAVTTIICSDWRQITPTYRQGLDTDLVNTLGQLCSPLNP